MAEKGKLTKFQKMLALAIGKNRTQAEFAKEVGLSPEHISRMLNQNNPSRPSRQTLNKIADHADGGVTLNMLLKACDMLDDEQDNKVSPIPVIYTPGDQIINYINGIKKGIEALLKDFPIYDSIPDFIGFVVMLYCEKESDIIISDELKPENGEGADAVRMVSASFSTPPYSYNFDFLVSYYNTQNGKVIISRALFTQQQLEPYGSKICEEIKSKGGFNPEGYCFKITATEGFKRPVMSDDTVRTIMDEIKTLAEAHSIDVPVQYGDSTKSVDKMISLSALDTILSEVLQEK